MSKDDLQFEVQREIYLTQWRNIRQLWDNGISAIRYLVTLTMLAIFTEYPDIEVKPIAFSASELKAAHWKFLMGAIGSQSMYMRQIKFIMRGLRDNLTLDALRADFDNSGLSDHLKELAQTRLLFAREDIDDNQRL